MNGYLLTLCSVERVNDEERFGRRADGNNRLRLDRSDSFLERWWTRTFDGVIIISYYCCCCCCYSTGQQQLSIASVFIVGPVDGDSLFCNENKNWIKILVSVYAMGKYSSNSGRAITKLELNIEPSSSIHCHIRMKERIKLSIITLLLA